MNSFFSIKKFYKKAKQTKKIHSELNGLRRFASKNMLSHISKVGV
jgi:hypothetical protein